MARQSDQRLRILFVDPQGGLEGILGLVELPQRQMGIAT